MLEYLISRIRHSIGSSLVLKVILTVNFLTVGQIGASAENVDLEIVLAVDASGSINTSEYTLQMKGYAEAFRDPSIHAAITSGPYGKIAVSLMLWSDAAFPKHATRWHLLHSAETALNFASVLDNFQGHSGRDFGIGGGGTGIGDGIRYAIEMLNANDISGVRKVVDVSGDGIETAPWFKKAIMLPDAKLLARKQSVVINGLAILTDFPHLDDWYRERVISGPGSFVIRARDFQAFGKSIRQKLLREFNPPIAHKPSQRRSKGLALIDMPRPLY